MPTLNTLRTRGALFLSIFIGVALIAFLLGDLTSAGSVFQSRKNRVGSIAGNHVDYLEFAGRVEKLNGIIQTIYGKSSLSTEEMDQIREIAWEGYVRRYSYDPGYRKLGLGVGETEQIDMVRGTYVSPVISGIFGGGTGVYDPAALEEFITNKEQDASGRLNAVWQYLKEEMVDERMSAKYTALVGGAVFVNDLELNYSMKATNTAFDGRFAKIPYTQIADSLVAVSSAEVNKYFKEHKNNFKQTASRELEYVVFELAPSEADFADAQTSVRELAAEFATAADPMVFAQSNSQGRTDATYKRYDAAFGAGEVVGPTLEGDVWTMSRLADERMMPDSVGARHILLPAGSGDKADSLVRAIRGGASIFELAPGYSIDPTVDLGRFAPYDMVPQFAEAVISAGANEVFKVDTQYGTHVVQMTYKAPAVRKVRVATIVYNVVPGTATEQAAYGSARDFLAAAAGSREKFNEAVGSTGANIRVATVSAGEREVRGLADSRELVRWSFNSKPGTVSSILEIDGDYVVAVLTGAKEEGFAELEEVTSQITATLRTEKKVEMLAAQMKGKSLDEVSAMEGATGGEFTELVSAASYDAGIGFEPGVIGSLHGLAEGAVSQPVKGFSGVYVVGVDAAAETGRTDEIGERARLETAAESSLPQRIMQTLRAATDITDNRSKFF